MRCLIVDFMHESTAQLLKKVGLDVTYQPEIKREELLEVIDQYEGLIIRSKTPVDGELISKASKLKFVGRAGAGVDNLDVQLLKNKNIAIVNAPEGNRNALAEHTMGLLLSLLNNVVKSDKEIRQSIWDREGNRGYELAGKTVGLMGYGFMGQAFARKLKAFDCKVIVYDKYKKNFSDDYCSEVSLESLFEQSDIFSIHVPLTDETRLLVDHSFFNSFKKNIYFINTSRGEIVSLEACCEALKTEKLIQVALDVLENEKLETLSPVQQNSFNYLINSDRVILTPHIAGWSFESFEKISQVLTEKINQFLTNNN